VNNKNKHVEWYFQSDYDLETAQDMFNSGRNVYCIFMCHLSIEKALKGLFLKTTGNYPIKSHSLMYFVEKIELKLSDSDDEFVFKLNKVSIPTRYPEDLQKLFNVYTNDRTKSILEETKKLQAWIKQQ